MGKRMCPKWATKKKKCKCGSYYYSILIGSSMKTTDACITCNPDQYRKKEK